MLETLRAYGLDRLAEASGQPQAAAALAGHALQVAEQAAAGWDPGTGERAAAQWLDAENATTQQALTWALEHDPATALRLAVALAPWWSLRGRWASGYQLLAAAAGHAPVGAEGWCAAQYWLGQLTANSDATTSFGHFTALRDALAGHAPVPLLARTLAARGGMLANMGHLSEAADEAHRALALARELGDPLGEAYALYWLGTAASYAGDFHDCVAWLRQAQRVDRAANLGWITRQVTMQLADALYEVGEIAEAQQHCADALALARQAGSLYHQVDSLVVMARLDLLTGRPTEARAHLRQALELFPQTSATVFLLNCLMACGYLCAAARRWPEAITVWAAYEATMQAAKLNPGEADEAQRREDLLREPRKALGPALARAAEERGAAMTPAAAADFALLLVTGEPDEQTAPAGLSRLSAREQELVTLVARGHTDAQIAGQLYISVRTVRSHLDRIRDKTGSRRRADLTRLALQAGLV
jgi:DNA-binding CsgD family transcriptional regulator/tetratricopeptide (TPR) repeat protein